MLGALEAAPIDLVVLDVMLPGEDGFAPLPTPARHLDPVIMPTAMGEETDRIIGFEMGADD
jgi:two-component system, OmpR family, response regulator